MVESGDEKRAPLAGRVVGLTRPANRAEGWARAMRRAGAEVVVAPVIAIEPPEDTGPLDDALGRLARERAYGWVVFTSITAVEVVIDRLETIGPLAQVFSGTKIAAVGKATAAALEDAGLKVDRVPARQDGTGLLATFDDEELRGESFLIPRAVAGREEFPSGARARGARVDVVDTYRTVENPAGVAALRERLVAGRLDAVVFGSPSQVSAVMRGLGEEAPLLSGCVLACIGSTTARAAEEAGLEVVTAQAPEPEAMIDLLVVALAR